VVDPRREDAVARPDEENQPSGGFETSAELRRTEEAEATPDAAAPAPRMEAPPTYDRPSSRRPLLVAAGVVLALIAVAVAIYLAV
jgi:ferric-dicitrate binding protein FerR (iron transport regulator)